VEEWNWKEKLVLRNDLKRIDVNQVGLTKPWPRIMRLRLPHQENHKAQFLSNQILNSEIKKQIN